MDLRVQSDDNGRLRIFIETVGVIRHRLEFASEMRTKI